MNVTRPLRVGIGLAVLGGLAAIKLPRHLRRGYDALARRGERVLHGGPGPVDPYEPGDRAGRTRARGSIRTGTPAGDTATAGGSPAGDLPGVPGPVVAHDELPLADYDHLTLGSLRARIRTLPPADLATLLNYERAHADRLPVTTLLENRLRSLANA